MVAGAKRERVTAEGEGRFHIEVREPAERNMANTRVRELVARACQVPVGKTRIVSGHRSTTKVISLG